MAEEVDCFYIHPKEYNWFITFLRPRVTWTQGVESDQCCRCNHTVCTTRSVYTLPAATLAVKLPTTTLTGSRWLVCPLDGDRMVTRGSGYRAERLGFGTDMSGYWFTNEVVSDWSGLDGNVVSAESVGSFGGRLDQSMDRDDRWDG